MNVYGYETKTTFWSDFSIADKFGIDAVIDTYKRAFEGWKDNAEYLTELVMVLNWKIWQHFEQDNDEFARVYDELWRTTDEWAYHNLKGEDLKYYFRTTD